MKDAHFGYTWLGTEYCTDVYAPFLLLFNVMLLVCTFLQAYDAQA